MSQSAWLSALETHRAIAVIRAPSLGLGRQMAKAVMEGGIRLIEVTWTSDRPADLITQLRTELPQCIIGVGTVLTMTDLEGAIAAGAQFAFSPHLNLELVQRAQQRSLPMIPGTLTPTEIVAAWQAGASAVKVFPIQAVGGADYLRWVRAPLGDIPLIPTGGVTLENARSFLEAGAIAVGLSGQLFPQQAIVEENWSWITDQAQALLQTLTRDQPIDS